MDSAMDYEILIRSAYNCDRYDRKGADADIFRFLEQSEWLARENPKDGKLQARYRKELEEVRAHTVDALMQGIKLLERRKEVSREHIATLQSDIIAVKAATNKDGLEAAIKIALDHFMKFEIRMS